MDFVIKQAKEAASLQASKWLKVQVMLDADEMRGLIQALDPLFFVNVSQPVSADQTTISPSDFLTAYSEYVLQLQQGTVPSAETFRRFFSCALTSTLDAFYALKVGEEKYLIRPSIPVIQLQAHHFFYSDLDGKFHPMVLSEESISWGIQFSYPQLFQDPTTRQIVKVTSEFPNTPVFSLLMKWVRNATLPTPFIIGDRRVNSPIRVGKQSLAWLNTHPQLKQRGIGLYDHRTALDRR